MTIKRTINEDLCLLYQSSQDEKNKNIILKKLWDKNMPFINIICKKIHNKNKYLIKEEILQEAFIVFKTCVDKFDIEKGSLLTYLRHRLFLRLLKIFSKEDNFYEKNISLTYQSEYCDYDGTCEFNDGMHYDDSETGLDKNILIENLFKLSDDIIVAKRFRLQQFQKDVIIFKLGLFGNTPTTFKELSIKLDLKQRSLENLYYKGIKKLKHIAERYLK